MNLLDEAEVTALEQLKDKLAVIKANIKQLIKKRRPSLLVWGAGGMGKTHTVRETLENENLKEGDGYVYYNSEISAPGLYERLKNHPDALIWIEDTETLFSDKKALGLIRSATGTQDGPRWVTWNVQKGPVLNFGEACWSCRTLTWAATRSWKPSRPA